MGSQWPSEGADAPVGLEPLTPPIRQGQGVASWQVGPAEERQEEEDCPMPGGQGGLRAHLRAA